MIVTSRILVKLRAFDDATIARVLGESGGEDSGRRIAPIRILVVTVPEGADPEAVRAALEAHPDVEYAHFDMIGQPKAYHAPAGNDPLLGQDWHLRRMNVYHAWQRLGSKGAAGVRVGVVDGGIYAHEDFDMTKVIGFNTSTGVADPADTACYYRFPVYSHGTEIHGFLFAVNNNGQGISGVCPDCTPVVIATGAEDSIPNYMMSDITAGVVKCVELGCRIISLSLGYASDYPEPLQGLHDAIDYAWANNVVVFAAAGNENLDLAYEASHSGTGGGYPAAWPNVVAVGAIGPDDAQGRTKTGAPFSTYGATVPITAPGAFYPIAGSFMATGVPGSYPLYSDTTGTSFACPLTAGVAALALSAYPGLTNQQLVDVVLGTQDAARNPAFATKFPAAGVANPSKAVLRALAMNPANAGVVYPYARFLAPGNGGAWDSVSIASGVAMTTLNGSGALEIGGYSSNPITTVELRVGGVQKYIGPPATLSIAATYDGAANPVTVIATSASGATATETYTDVLVTSLTVNAGVTAGRSSSASPLARVSARRSTAATPVLAAKARRSAATNLRRLLALRAVATYGGEFSAPVTETLALDAYIGTARRSSTASAVQRAATRRSAASQPAATSRARRAASASANTSGVARRSAVAPLAPGNMLSLRATATYGGELGSALEQVRLVAGTAAAGRRSGVTLPAAGAPQRRSGTTTAQATRTTRRASTSTPSTQAGTARRSAAAGAAFHEGAGQRSATASGKGKATTRRSATTQAQAAAAQRRSATTQADPGPATIATSARSGTTTAAAISSRRSAATKAAAVTTRRGATAIPAKALEGRRAGTTLPADTSTDRRSATAAGQRTAKGLRSAAATARGPDGITGAERRSGSTIPNARKRAPGKGKKPRIGTVQPRIRIGRVPPRTKIDRGST